MERLLYSNPTRLQFMKHLEVQEALSLAFSASLSLHPRRTTDFVFFKKNRISPSHFLWVDTCVGQARCVHTDRTTLHVAHDNVRAINAYARCIFLRHSNSSVLN